MSLLRIPFILGAAVAFHLAATPPPTKVSDANKFYSFRWEHIFNLVHPHYIQRTICWEAAIAECAVLLACRYPHLAISQQILQVLFFAGDADKLRLTTMFVCGTSMVFLGSLLRCICFGTLGPFFTFETGVQKYHKLVTRGPYKVVRHPSYTGLIAIAIGFLCWHGSPDSWVRHSEVLNTAIGTVNAVVFSCVAVSVMYMVVKRVPKEDEQLRERFGQEWIDWQRRVPYALVPGIW